MLLNTSISVRMNDEIFPYISKEIQNAKTSLKIAVAWFTDPELLKHVLDKKNVSSFSLEVIIFNHEINNKLSDLRLLKDNLKYCKLANEAIMHHKFAIIDNKTLITGS